MPNKIIAISKEAFNDVNIREMSLRSQKAFAIPLTKVFWGVPESEKDELFIRPVTAPNIEIKVPISYIADILGYKVNNRLTAEIRRIYREMEKEAYGMIDPDSLEQKLIIQEEKIIYRLTKFSKGRDGEKYAVFHVLRPEALYRLPYVEHGFWTFHADDIFSFTSKYSLRVLNLLMRCSEGDCINANTIFLKYFLGHGVLDYCTISDNSLDDMFMKRHDLKGDGFRIFADQYAEILESATLGKWFKIPNWRTKYNEDMQWLQARYNFSSKKEVDKAFGAIVDFDRTQFHDILQKALTEINNGHMFQISQYNNEIKYKGAVKEVELFFKINRRKNNTISSYTIGRCKKKY